MDDFERRRELRRQKREEMRLEAERIAYQRNDDDEEEAARERRRRARQERLRQKQEEEALGQVTDQVEVNTQNSVPDEEVKTTTTNTQAEGDDEAALLERLARREERRQKRLQEALERQKEFDPTITDASLSLSSRRMQNNTTDNETAEKEGKSESCQERQELEETEIVTESHQKNDWMEAEEKKKEEKEKEEEEEEKPKPGSIEENQVEVVVEEKTADTQQETVMPLKNGQISADEPKTEEEGERGSDEILQNEKMEEEARERAEAERARLEAEERERIKAEQDRKIAEEKAKKEAEEKAAAQERERQEAEERERIKEEERKAEEERQRIKEQERKAEEERQRIKEQERKAEEERQRIKEQERKAEEERQRAKAEEEERAKIEEQKRKKQLEEKKGQMQEKKIKGEKVEEKTAGKGVNEKKVQEDKPHTAVPKKQEEERGAKVPAKREKSQEDKAAFKKEELKDEKTKKDKESKDVKSFLDAKKGFTEVKSQNGEFMTHKLKHTENTFSRAGGRVSEAKEAEGTSQVEAGKRLEELRRRRGETESEEFEKLKQKQQEAALELEELKKKREERRKVLEEEEQRKKQEEAERKVREEEEKRRLKEEIERRRAEAAEKRQKMPEDGLSEDKKPFKCFTPKGSSLKIEERAEFLNKSVQKSGVKSTHQAAVVSKIDSRLEQYTSAIEGTKAAKPTKPAASDLPVPAEGVRNIKSMWEKGNVFSSPTASGTPNKETAGLKVGVSSRINEWLTKTPEGSKSPAPKPSDLRPGDVSGKRNLWEKQSVDKVTSPTKV
ncbi:caldesmon isoform X1 [Bubalus bubalis]|uniref:caldesmon isoform X1 n=1 Tax=Bubalus bubalis TaxID=89462 RepID=UPI000DBC5F67|nr:caldesmon isoform X1 [Bubalus bubalis]XP_025147337.1 caldesmon isoform X1 [Bubalus bubalis]XP_025147338.1 caldesmon isoform X1 [Bubalus bubalis]XP_025147339.1 caldesmon isoform X1 [Bubalus bubalis]XP_025147340.1 caldesmon isoform X1 [Bubalus bubalis]XP_044802818.1 caldesmon isoform X1 [Bubalus bubalis]XP_044802819.1 caldesmon isoform X1 [Bubalus bubalis]